MAIRNVTNEVANKQVLYGTEAQPGVAIAPDGRLFGTWEASKSRALRRTEEATGGYDRFTAISRETESYSGSYREEPSYESLPAVLRYGLAGGDAPVADANANVAYTRVMRPAPAVDDIDTATIVSGIEGLPFQATGVRWNEWTLSWSAANGAWEFSASPVMRSFGRLPGAFEGVVTAATATSITMTGADQTIDAWVGSYIFIDFGTHIGPVRMVEDSTADTWTWEGVVSPVPTVGSRFMVVPHLPIVPDDVPREIIKGDTLDVYLDLWKADGTAIGTTLVSDRVLEFSLSQALNLATKNRASGISDRYGRGARWYTGNIRFEFDRWDEYEEWEDDDWVSIRVEKRGSVIDPTAGTTHLFRIDLDKVAWDVFTEDAEEHNMTATLSYVAALPIGSPNDIVEVTTVNTLAVLA